MNDFFKTWTDVWASNQQAMKTLLPTPPAPVNASEEGQAPLDDQFKELRGTWQASIEKWTEFARGDSKSGALTPETLKDFFGPAAWSGAAPGAVDAGLRQVLEGPKYALLWDHDRKLLELQQRAAERDKDLAAYQAVVQKAWNTAFERFSTAFTSTESKRPATWRGLADRWLKVVNDTLIEVHRSEEFLDAQRQMLRSASEYRLQERKIAEAWCEASHIPTRTEMDEMQRTVSELKRQLRALQRREKAIAAPPAARAAEGVVSDREDAAGEPAGDVAPLKGSKPPSKKATARQPRPAKSLSDPAPGTKTPSTRRSTRT